MQRALALTLAILVGLPAVSAAAEKKSAAVEVVTASAKKILLFPTEDLLVRYVNGTRKRYGLPELKVCENLMGSARQHCYWMAGSGSLQHTSAQVAENIAQGQRDTTE